MVFESIRSYAAPFELCIPRDTSRIGGIDRTLMQCIMQCRIRTIPSKVGRNPSINVLALAMVRARTRIRWKKLSPTSCMQRRREHILPYPDLFSCQQVRIAYTPIHTSIHPSRAFFVTTGRFSWIPVGVSRENSRVRPCILGTSLPAP